MIGLIGLLLGLALHLASIALLYLQTVQKTQNTEFKIDGKKCQESHDIESTSFSIRAMQSSVKKSLGSVGQLTSVGAAGAATAAGDASDILFKSPYKPGRSNRYPPFY